MTDVQICNTALSSLGLERISSLTSSANEAVACNLHYRSTVNELLAEHGWNWARKRETLALSAGANLTARDNLYQQPSDIIRLISLHDSDAAEITDYDIEGDKYAVDVEDISALYVPEVTDPSRYPPMFAQAVAMRLASKLAIEFQQARSLEQDALQKSMMYLERARQIDQVQTKPAETETAWEGIF